MGHGHYSYDSSLVRSSVMRYDTKSTSEIFTQKKVNNAMDPSGILVRESRDSKDHPKSIPIILALDVTGSMGSIPHFLVKEGFREIMKKIIDAGVADPQVLFAGIGDHECDRSPLQVGQFESSDELLESWLTKLYLEGGGGGNDGESYLLAWFFASRYTFTDHHEKRGQKGILFTIGDEPTLKNLPANVQKHLMGEGQYSALTAAEVLEKAREKYEVFHLHVLQGSNGSRQDVKDGWKQLMGDNVLFVQRKEEIAQVMADVVLDVIAKQDKTISKKVLKDSKKKSAESEEEIL